MPASVEDPRTAWLPERIVHVHIPKTAGSALNEAFQQAYGDRLRVYPEKFEARYSRDNLAGYNFFAGHFGFTVACEIGGDLITVLRDPVDRIVSGYFFMRQLYSSGKEISHKSSIAMQYDLDQFLQIRDEPILEQVLHNAMTWQIAHSVRLNRRQELKDAGINDPEWVLRAALNNLRKFTIVGLQTDLPKLSEDIKKRYNIRIPIGRVNVTANRPALVDIPFKTLERIEWWVNLDTILYRTWSRANLHGSICSQQPGLR
jgi:hypothetical protein